MTKPLCAVCGLYCEACVVYIATKEDRERLKLMAARRGVSPEEMACEGCRSNHRGAACRTCEFIGCAEEKGVEFCNACETYPCENLKQFNAQMPHRAELWEDNARIQAVGCDVWFEEMEKHYSCKGCGAMNSAYDLECRKCGHAPSNDFVARHEAAIRAYWQRLTSSKP